METKNVGVFVGSLRKGSYSRKIAKELMRVSPDSLRMEEVLLGNLPLYNQDYDDENKVPREYGTFRDQVRSCDAFLFVTPEYNRSVPAVLKNALDVGSRPYGQSVWDGKPGAIISVSPGKLSGFGANHHLRQSMVFLNVPILQQPEAYIGEVGTLFDENGVMTNESTRQFLRNFVETFSRWILANTLMKQK